MFPKRLPISVWNPSTKPRVPKVITFDAYNTLYATTLPVMEQYCLIADKYGVKADPDELTKNFPAIFKALKAEHPNYGKYTNITANQWWSHLITNIFKPLNIPREMIDEILERFEGLDAYVVYPDLFDILRLITREYPNTVIGIISNTDPVVYTLMKNIGLLDYFQNHIYLSYDLEVKKPSTEIFQCALKDIVKKHPKILDGITIDELKKDCWHVGDEAQNDMLGAKQAGWNGILIDRCDKYGYFAGSVSASERDEHSVSVDKIDHNFQETWARSLEQTDAIQLSKNTFVIPNYNVLQKMLF